MKTVGLAIIGAEVLSGKVQDENGPFLIRELRGLGARLGELRVIDDGLTIIERTVRELSGQFDFLITTGGIGPTHDDLTVAGVAAAFSVPVVREPTLETSLRTYYGDALTENHLRLADVPEGAVLHGERVPTIQMRNTFVLPGVPSLMRSCFERVREQFRGDAFITRILFLNASESTIADALSAADRAHPAVQIGSYPRFDDASARVKVTVEGTDRPAVDAALAQLRETLPAGVILDEKEESQL
ncbi:MAG: molybdopterin-binding protein [Myxococcota bacterium]